MALRRKSRSVHNSPPSFFLLFWVCLWVILSYIFSLCLAFFPVSFRTLLRPDYIALFYLLLMCSNNVCRQASPIPSTVLFYSLSVLFSYPLCLSCNHTPHTPQKFFRTRYYIHLFIMSLLLSPLYILRLSPLSFIISCSTICGPHTTHENICPLPLLYSFDPLLLWWGVALCRVLMRTKRQGYASRLRPR